MATTTNKPDPFVVIWAEDGLKFLTIHELEENRNNTKDENGNKLHPARATMNEGFPEITMKSAMRGGVPPWGQDHNKILNQITDAIRWMQAGGCAFFNQKLCTKINGYPKGAMLQGKKIVKNDKNEDVEMPLLWFSTEDMNNNDPNTTTSPGNGWVKLDFADLEKRLKAAELTIINHEGRLTKAEGAIESQGERLTTAEGNIETLKTSKAEKEGSCGQLFQASTMSAQEYNFGCCKEDADKANSYFIESGRLLYLYTDTAFRFWVNNKDNLVLSLEQNFTTINGKVGINLSTGDAGQVVTNSHIRMEEGKQFIHLNTKNSRAWYMETRDNDYIIGCYPDGYTKVEKTMPTAIRISQADDNQHYNIHASGAFVNGDADLAEYYQADRQDYEPGTLMCHGVKTEVTLCKNTDQSNDFFGIISTRPGYIMNSNAETDPSYVLIALNGKVPVKVKGVVKCGDKITVGQDGYGVVSQNKNDVIVGRAKEDKITEEVGLVSCYVQAHI